MLQTATVNVKTIELSLDAAKAMLPVVENELQVAEHTLEAAHQKVAELKRLASELRAKTTNALLPLQNGGTLRKRRPKGFAAQAIEGLLANLPKGEGYSLNQIQAMTSIDHSTIYRTLKTPERNKGKFIEVDGKWKLSK